MPSGCSSEGRLRPASARAEFFVRATGHEGLSRSHSPIGFVTSGTPDVQSTLAGARTS